MYKLFYVYIIGYDRYGAPPAPARQPGPFDRGRTVCSLQSKDEIVRRNANRRPGSGVERGSGRRELLADLIHRGELAAAEILDLRRQAAALANPVADFLRIGVHQQLGTVGGRDHSGFLAGPPSGMESQ